MKKPEMYQIYFARFISVLLHPLFMPAYGLMIIFTAPTLYFYLPAEVKKILMLVLVANNIIVPAALIPLFRHRNIISSWTMEKREERVIPLRATAVTYVITSIIVNRFGLPVMIKAYFNSVSIVALAMLVINFRFNISLHSAGAGALTAVVAVLWIVMAENLVWFMVPVLLVSGLIITLRLILNAHKPAEVYAGYLTGLAIVSVVMLIFQ